MQTSALISYIKRGASDWSRDDIREFLNDIQTMVFGRPLHSMRIIDESTGKNPVLSTVAGTHTYEVPGVQYIAEIFTQEELDSCAYGNNNCLDSNRKFSYNFDPTPANPVTKIILRDDPEDKIIHYVGYRAPANIMTESIQLSIPDQYHISYIAEGVWGLIEQVEHGDSNRWKRFEIELLPTLQSKLDNQFQDKTLFISGQGY